jgi:ABC-type branched-subunit amino acid transport system substrate-binding protein
MDARHRWTGQAFCWALIALASLFSGCSKGGGDTDILTVGAYFSLSGVESPFGNDSRESIEMATDEINAAGGIAPPCRGAKLPL